MNKIAERQLISLPYLEQLFAKLLRAGLVTSTRGPGGGYVLARPADKIYIGEVMQAVGEPVKMTRCEHGVDPEKGCLNGNECITHTLWDALSDHIYSFLASVSLQDVVDKRVGAFGTLVEQLEMTGKKSNVKGLGQSGGEFQ